jgi:hypothetical protein
MVSIVSPFAGVAGRHDHLRCGCPLYCGQKASIAASVVMATSLGVSRREPLKLLNQASRDPFSREVGSAPGWQAPAW